MRTFQIGLLCAVIFLLGSIREGDSQPVRQGATNLDNLDSHVAAGVDRHRRQIPFAFPNQFGPGGQLGPQKGHRRPQPPRRHQNNHQMVFPGFQQGGLSNANANTNSQTLQAGGAGRFPVAQGIPGGSGRFPVRPAINNNADAHGQASNQNAAYQQQAGADTSSQNVVNEQGQFTGNTGSSISSNLANDGSSGQLSAANTGQQSYNTADGSGEKNAAQSQSLNFDKGNTQATASNADTSHVKTATGERQEANSGATVNQQNELGLSANSAQTHTATSNENGLQSTQSNANSQSVFQGANGAQSGSNTGATAGTKQGPNGLVTNTASSQAASFSNNGGPASASASSSSGTGPNGSFANSQGFTNTGASNAFTGLRRKQAFGGGQAHAIGDSQFLRQALSQLRGRPQQRAIAEPPGASVTTADSEAFSRDIQVGKLLGINGGLTRSQSMTQNENGDSEAERSTSLTKGVKIGKLDLSSTVTGTKTVENGKVSRELSKNVKIGNIGIDSSLSKDNLKNGIGIRRSEDGGLDLDLGLLSVDLSKGKKPPAMTGTNVDIQAVGEGASANTASKTDSDTKTFGKITTTGTHSRSSGIGSVLKGLTGGFARGIAGGAPSGAATGLFRQRRQMDFIFPDQIGPDGIYRPQHTDRQPPQLSPRPHQTGLPGSQQGGVSNSNANANVNTIPKQRQSGGQPAPGGFPIVPASNNNANAHGQASNQNAAFQQQAGADTNSQNIVNEHGQFSSNTGSSISSNLAKDGSAGQLSAANTAQQSYNTAEGSGVKNAAQSQSLNFDKGNIHATSTNADTSHVKSATGERQESNSGATANQETEFGSSGNTAQTHTLTSNENGVQKTESKANSQSVFHGPGGTQHGSNTGATAGTVQGPNGLVTNTASSQASSFSNNGGPVSASASSSSSSGPNGSFAQSQGFTNSGASNGFAGLGWPPAFGSGQASAFDAPRRRCQRDVEPRTFDTILSLVQGLFETDCNQCTPYMVSTNQNNCCTKCCSPCCPQCCYYPPPATVTPPPRPPLPPPRPLPPPPPPPPRPQVSAVQITSAVFSPWYYPYPVRRCCSTCSPQIGPRPCGYGGWGSWGGRPYFPPYGYYG